MSKLSASGTSLAYSTYLGGSSLVTNPWWNDYGDEARGIAVDASGSACVTGFTATTDFPTANALQSNYPNTMNVGNSAFVSKLSASGTSLVYSYDLTIREAGGRMQGYDFFAHVKAFQRGNLHDLAWDAADKWNWATITRTIIV